MHISTTKERVLNKSLEILLLSKRTIGFLILVMRGSFSIHFN